MTTATVVLPNAVRPLAHDTGSPNGRTPYKQNGFKQDLKQVHDKVILSESTQHFHSHGLIHLRHFPSHSPVRFMIYSEPAAAPISLHSDDTVCLYDADGHKQILPAPFPYLGLTATKISGCFVGWGPGATFTLLDSELRRLDDAPDGLDILVCQAAEHSTDLVTAGAGNVCVWSVMLMSCKLKIQGGLEHRDFTHLALVPPQSGRHHRAFVACGQVLMVVDLDDGKVLKNKRRLCSSDITAMVYCVQLDCVVIASERGSVKIFSVDLESRGAFSGHKGVVNTLFYCIESSTLVCSTNKGTICRWNMKERDPIECFYTEQKIPQLYIGGARKGDPLFSYSQQGVNIWTYQSLYSLHCQLAGDESVPLRQIVVTQFPAPYPTRVLCVSGDYDISLLASETGDVLTSFKAKNKILCADYCLHKEVLLALTEERTVLQANTCTNPITLMEEWGGTGQESCRWMRSFTNGDDQNVETPGPACCLALYNSVTDEEEAFEKWIHLQEQKGSGHQTKTTFNDVKNKFLVILGQSGGYVSVLKISTGKVMCTMRAHNGQRVTRVQVYPENSCLLSTGEDHTVAVWRVNPYVDECLTPKLSLQCGSPQVYLAALGPLLALTSEDPFSHVYVLQLFDIHQQSQTGHQPRKGHSGYFTGLCVFPEIKVFISSSLDRTLHIWSETNRLLRTLHLNAVPQCIGHSGFGDELFLGIKGDLYKMNCAKFLRGSDQPKVRDPDIAAPPADVPIPIRRKYVRESSLKEGESQAIVKEPLLTDDSYLEKDMITTLNTDLETLVKCTVQCKKGKPPSTKQTKKEAFERYMKIIYGLLPTFEDDFEEVEEPEIFTCSRKFIRPPKPEKDVEPAPEIRKKRTKKMVPEAVEVDDEEAIRRTSTGFRREYMPAFLIPFAETDWFKDLYPDKKHISRTLSPDDFALQVVGHLQTCRKKSGTGGEIVSALQSLHHQQLLKRRDGLYQGLLDTVPMFARPQMAPVDRILVGEISSFLAHLKPPTFDLIKVLLTLLANKEMGLRQQALSTLRKLGVTSEEWLLPEVDRWYRELQNQPDPWASLYSKADSWLELWTSKYKEHNRYMFVRDSTEWQPMTVDPVDVLNFFGFVRDAENEKAKSVAPPGRKDTTFLPLYDCYQPIFRLGETHTMSRIRKSPAFSLPPLRTRACLRRFPPFILFPLTHLTLKPFHVYTDEDWVKIYTQRYFVPEEACTDYYR